MNDTLFVIIGTASIAAFIFAFLSQPPRPPQIIYVQTVESDPKRSGCFQAFIFAILIVISLGLLASCQG